MFLSEEGSGLAAILSGLLRTILLLVIAGRVALADISVTDDAGNRVELAEPARRIISLAPHITEMLYSAGAEAEIVGTVSYSDYPAAAKNIPRVGDAANLDLEAVMALKPDLVVAWRSGTPLQSIASLKRLGLTLYLSEPEGLAGIADNIVDLGRLSGHSELARRNTRSYLERLRKLEERYRRRDPVRVFYQIWQQPLMTINGSHLISHVIELCGGVNLFSELPSLAPQVSLESVLAKDIQAILISARSETDTSALQYWQRWQNLQAVRDRHIYNIPWDLISRHSLRIAEGAEFVCETIERVRTGNASAGEKTPSRPR